MLNQQLISSKIEPLNYTQSVGEALTLMNNQDVVHLPLIKDGIYEGLLMEEDLLDAGKDDNLSLFQHDLLPFSVQAGDHFLSAAKLSASRHLDLVPVVSSNKEYMGTILEKDLLKQFNRLNGVLEEGALIVVGMPRHRFSVGEISKLVETNDASITQLNTFTDEQTGDLIVTIRINKFEISDIIATFQRYDYQVLFHAGEEHFENEIRRNYHHLMNFLEM